jgi:Delta3-Delta2-enoyl-CoA isomerase
MSAFRLEKQDKVFIITFVDNNTDNTFTSDVLLELNTLYDEIENAPGDAALIITSEHPKTFCNGINLDSLNKLAQEERKAFIHALENLFIRTAIINLPTVACITGNAYAGGAILATTMDFRIMRADRGRFCYSEINIKMAFTRAMYSCINLLPNRHAKNEMALTGLALGGEEAYARNVVDAIYPQATLAEETLKRAQTLASKHRRTYSKIKSGLRPEMVALAEQRKISLIEPQ